MTAATAKLSTFRVHFHDETSLDIDAASPTLAEAQAKKRRPGNFVKKIKILRGPRVDDAISSAKGQADER